VAARLTLGQSKGKLSLSLRSNRWPSWSPRRRQPVWPWPRARANCPCLPRWRRPGRRPGWPGNRGDLPGCV